MGSVELITVLMPLTKASRYLARSVGYLCHHGPCQASYAKICKPVYLVPRKVATSLQGWLAACTLQTARALSTGLHAQ